MTARTFLVHGLLAGILAGLAAFLVAHQVGEPHVEAAIALESQDHTHAAATPAHTHDDEDAVVSRFSQRTFGLLTGTLVVGVALGGLAGLVAAGVAGRLGRLSLRQSTAAVVAIGYVAYAFVPFLKYPASPPGVGSGESIGERTALYFGFVVLSLVAAVAMTVLAARLAGRLDGFTAALVGIGGYLLVMVVTGWLFAPAQGVGDGFPADTLWGFRRASLLTQLTLWGTLGGALMWLVGRRGDQEAAKAERKRLAASL